MQIHSWLLNPSALAPMCNLTTPSEEEIMANHSRLVVHCHPAWQMVPPAGCTRAANAALHQRHGLEASESSSRGGHPKETLQLASASCWASLQCSPERDETWRKASFHTAKSLHSGVFSFRRPTAYTASCVNNWHMFASQRLKRFSRSRSARGCRLRPR